METKTLDTFTRAYLVCALWSSTDGDPPEPLDRDYGIEDFSTEALEQAVADCASFQKANAADIGTRDEGAGHAGHDFWLTRNGHGAGFWDGDWPEDAGKRLTDAAHGYGELSPYVGDDGMIHFQ